MDLSAGSKVKRFMLEPTGSYGYRLVVDLYPENGGRSAVKKLSDRQQQDRDIVVAIDAGHGGEDPGATGRKRTREKTLCSQLQKSSKNPLMPSPA